jgi:membrane protein
MSNSQSGRVDLPRNDIPVTLRDHWRRLWSLRWPHVKDLLLSVMDCWFTHKVPRLGASLAFYSILSMAPLLIVVVAIASFVFGRAAAEGQLVWQIQGLVGLSGAEAIQTLLKSSSKPAQGTLATALGLFTLFFGATTVVAELRDALDTIWEVPPPEQTGWRSIIAVLKDRTLAFAMVLGIGFLLLISLAVNAALSALGAYFSGVLPTSLWALQAIDILISLTVISVLFGLMFKVLPDLDIQWGDVLPGSVITAALFTVGKTLIGIYLGRASFGSTYGAAGSLVIVLVWIYYSAQIFFLGAEFTRAYAQKYGSRPLSRVGKQIKIVSVIPQDSTSTVAPDKGDSLISRP